MKRYGLTVALAASVMLAGAIVASAPPERHDLTAIQTSDLQQWLTFLSSDEMEGRANFSEGLGLAGEYIAEQARELGVKPGGDDGGYLERVTVLGVKATSRSTLTVEVNGQTRTFKDGEGIEFPKNVGGKRRFTADQVEFLGYGLNAPQIKHNDYASRDVKGAVVVWLGATGPKGLDPQQARRILTGRNRYATETAQAGAAIGAEIPAPPRPGQAPGGPPAETPAGQSPASRPDFTTVQRLDDPIPPTVTAKDEFFEFLFSGAETKYSELKRRASAQQPLPPFRLTGVKLTFNLDADYQVVRTQHTHNVVGVVEGSDPALKNTYVVFGAHYDHLGYAEGEVVPSHQGPVRQGAPGRVKDGSIEDRIWNGADDDGSGSVALLAIAKAFLAGPRPKRSILLVWFCGEERGLWGSRYHAEFGPTDKIVAELNFDMIGRNRDDKPEEGNTVYLIGSDRISTELHNINVDANASLPKPLKLDYEFNDPADPENLYFRSDHYSYASKGVPIILFTTGLHPDYHYNTDSIEKIQFEKLTRITQLAYETGLRVADLDHLPGRDNKGPRAGKGSSGKIVSLVP
jgi:hypothetical protein